MAESEDSWGGTDVQDNVEFPGADFGGNDTYTEVRHTGWLERIGGSIMGALFGLAIFLGSFVLLYWNEGRQDMAEIAKTAVAVSGNAPSHRTVGKLVAVSGKLATDEQVGDEYFRPGPYLAVRRDAEMYAWIEESHTETKKNAGGSETKVTTYSYHKGWTDSPDTSMHKRQYNNPSMRVRDYTSKAKAANVGVYDVDMDTLDLPGFKRVTLTHENTRGGEPAGTWLYLGARHSYPAVGDIRVSYDVVPSGQQVTLMGKQDTDTHVAAYLHSTGDTLYRAFSGSKDEAVKTLHGEFVMMTWILRLVGFLMMWGGLTMMAEPINVLLDVLPFLGDLGRGLSGFVNFLIAGPLTIVTVIVAKIAHNLFAMIAVGVVMVFLGAGLFGKKKDELTRKVKRA